MGGGAESYSKVLAPEKAVIVVKYLDENGKEIHESKKLAGTIGESYNIGTEDYQLEIEGYLIDDTRLPNTNGNFQEANSTINLYYKKIAAQDEQSAETPSVLYRSHVQSNGWQDFVKNGEVSGTNGQNKRLEAVQLRIEDTSLDGGIQYRTHIQSIGWESSFKANNALSGTIGESKRLEAIQIKLTGDVAKYFDVYYRVNVQGFGLLDWAKNGESAGTEGLAYRLESLQVRLIKKGSNELTSSSKAFVKRPILSYRSHVESIGWQGYVTDGQKTGTSGQNKRLEAIQIQIENSGLTGSIQYRTHIQSIGWESSFKSNNEISGTTGNKKRLEAIQISLTGDIAQYFDVYYRVHSRSLGWLSWAKNGESAGTEGMACRMEALEIKLVPKGSNQLVSSPKAFVRAPKISYRTHVQSIGWQNYVGNAQTSGTSGQSKRVEAIQIQTENNTLAGGIQYRTHIQSKGWESSFKYNNEVSGSTGQAKRLEATQIQLSGEVAKYFDIYYRVHAQTFGWLGWAKNGMNAGTEAYGYRLEAIQIKVVPKWETAPSPLSNSYKKKPSKPTLSTFLGTTKSRIFNELQKHENDWYYQTTPFVGSLGINESVMSPRGNPTRYGPGMNCTGFIATVARQGGGNLSAITRVSNQYGGPANGYNWRNALVPNIQYYSFRTVSDLLRSGQATKGDLIYFEADFSRPNPDCHLGFFWGNNSSHDRIWHSTFPSNKISQIYSATPYSKVYLFKL
ncbi:MucBP domain-containing protein [Enterococcus pingfangensis]|uniref:MucBP domain-containing protein n=1 Tax=Enterococcus pingfangensis TaxID=2559924 RepID=UPI0010F4AB36|nr:MucBP domain-containing protein [Enterococcus pingfangensis]